MTAMPASAAGLRPALEATLDARAENLHQQTLVWDPSPECDSLVEHVAQLLRMAGGNTELVTVVSAITSGLRQLMDSNAREGSCELTAAGILDGQVAGLHHNGARSTLTVKAAARALRPALTTIAGAPDGVAFFRAAGRVRDVLAALPGEILHGNGLRHELGAGRHDLLLSLVSDGAEAVA